MIEFINDLEEGWATGKLIDTGKVGHYPTNFVEVSTTNFFFVTFRGTLYFDSNHFDCFYRGKVVLSRVQ